MILFVLVVCSGSFLALGLFVTSFLRSAALENSRTWGKWLAESMAIPCTEILLYQDAQSVQGREMLGNIMRQIVEHKELSIGYALVSDPSGKILAAHDFSRLGKPVPDLGPGAESLGPDTTVEMSESWIDLTYLRFQTKLHIHTKQWGVLHIGITLSPLYSTLGKVVRYLALLFLGVCGIVVSVVSLVASYLLRPLEQLKQAMDAADLESPQRLPSELTGLRNEFGDLARDYQRMVERLAQSHAEVQRHLERMIQTEALASVGRLSASVVHEVNNPLDGIQNCVHVLQEHPDDPALRKKYLPLIQDGLARISRITQELLSFARQQPPEWHTTNLTILLTEALELCGHSLESRGIVIQTHFEEIPLLEVDGKKLQQVFLNLIINAADAMSGGGKLSTSIRVASNDQQRRVEVTVEDTGIGIDPETLPRIFEPFFTTKEKGKSMGLGLYVSREIVRQHGGTLELQSTPGKGTVALLALPLDQGGVG